MSTGPVPTPAPRFSGVKSFLANNAVALLLGVGFVGYLYTRPTPAPYEPPVAVAAKAYVRTMSDAWTIAAQKVRSSQIQTKDDLVAELGKHSEPMIQALDTAIAPMHESDKPGRITNPAGVADVLEQAANAFKAKGK